MLPVTNSRGKFLSVLDLESQFEWIKADARHSDGENCLNYVCMCISVKAMLHEAIFPATCLATVMTEKHCKLQRGCHTFAIFFCNLQRPHWKLFTILSPPA